ncbi:MAG: prephenate dehydratase, partial [Acidimicrobiia bacterium]|nr:prephenate dehydratase [Acidimicrobiia bacterium]
MNIGYQGEAFSYSYRAVGELFPDAVASGYASFVEAFQALEDGEVERLVLPVENSTTGSVLPVLDRLPGNDDHGPISIIAEHLVDVRHALLGVPGTDLGDVKYVKSHPEALSQASTRLMELGLHPVLIHDTAGAVREVAADGDPAVAALGPPEAAEPHGLEVLEADVIDREHNT